MTTSRELALEKLRQALALVERAQRTLEEACVELCPILGFVGDWQESHRLAERVNAYWLRLNAHVEQAERGDAPADFVERTSQTSETFEASETSRTSGAAEAEEAGE